MKKNFTLKKSLLVAAMVFMSLGAQAQLNWKYVPLWGQFKAYPADGGKVSATIAKSPNAEAPEGSNFGEPASLIDVKFASRTLSSVYANVTTTAVPNEGWKFAGFAEQKYEDGDPVLPTVPETTDNPKGLRVTSQLYSKDDLTDTAEEAFAKFPAEPDNVYYALFTRVTVGLDYLSELLGTVEIDKTVNDVGQQVTITATPKEEMKAQFAYWVEESTGNKITENPYTFTVSGADHYSPVFTSDNFFTIDFPEEGGYKEFYAENVVYFPEDIKRMDFFSNELKKTGEQAYFNVQNYTKAVPATNPTYFYGKGTQTFLNDPNDRDPNQFLMHSYPLEQWSGEEGVELTTYTITVKIPIGFYEEKDSVVGDVNAYLLNAEKNVFERVTEAKVPAKRVFLAIPKFYLDQVEEGFVPDMIYLTEEEAEAAGVNGVQVDKPMKNGKIYTLDGKQVASPKQKGVYIYDGKKLIFRK
jgi:hypothetical protein